MPRAEKQIFEVRHGSLQYGRQTRDKRTQTDIWANLKVEIMLPTFIKAGNKSRWVKYETRLVWYAPDVRDRATSIAFWRTSTILVSANVFEQSRQHTGPARSYYVLYGVCKFREHHINIVQTGEHRDNIRAWVRVSFRQYSS